MKKQIGKIICRTIGCQSLLPHKTGMKVCWWVVDKFWPEEKDTNTK